MTSEMFRALHKKNLPFFVGRNLDKNPLDSSTDPTQDVPVKRIMFNALGVPMNCTENKRLVHSNIPLDKMTTLDKRNFDKFDALGELQDAGNSVHRVAKREILKNTIENEK